MDNENAVRRSPVGGQQRPEWVSPRLVPISQSQKTTEPLPGVQVNEFEATLPLEIYGELFKDRS
jgi:hypothetical protein